MEKFGAPAHPASLTWLAYAREGDGDAIPILGVASGGMFCKATTADLLLLPVLAGERITADQIVALGQGGLLNKQIAFKFPPYDETKP